MQEHVFDTDRLVPTFFRQTLPVVLSSVVTVVYNLVDTYFIAQTQDELLVAGVSICAPVFIILMAFGNIFGHGAGSLISRLLGQDQKDRVAKISAFVFWLAILTGIVAAVPLLLFRRQALFVLGASERTFFHGESYYTILTASSPVILLSFIHSNLLRCEGRATVSMIGTVLGAVVNMILDPIFIMVLKLGAAGAAWATVMGYLASDLFLLVFVVRKSRYFSVDPRICRVNGHELFQILSVGVTVAVANVASSAATIFMNQFLLGFGDDKIAAMGIVSKVNMFALMILTGFSFGGMPLYGYLYGARKYDKLKSLLRFALLFVSALALVLSACIILLAPTLVHVFMDNEAIVRDGTVMLRWQVAGSVFAGVVMLLTCLFQGIGKAKPALALSLSRQGVLFIVVFLIMTAVAGYDGFLASQLIADFLSAALAVLLYRFVFLKAVSPSAQTI